MRSALAAGRRGARALGSAHRHGGVVGCRAISTAKGSGNGSWYARGAQAWGSDDGEGGRRALSSNSAPEHVVTDDLSNFKGKSYPYHVPVEVRWDDMDAFNHVNNSRYFTFFEQARLAHFRDCGLLPLDIHSAPSQPVIKATSCRYRAMLVVPADILVALWVGNVTETSMDHSYVVYNEQTGRVVAEGEAGKVEF